MNTDNYFKERLEDQINWYDKKSIVKQKAYNRLRYLELFFASLIPVFSLILQSYPEILIKDTLFFGVIGVIISILASIINFGKYQELWQSYRTTCESLRKEKYLFSTGAKPYNKENRFVLLVERVESLISKENTNWSEMIKSEDN